MLADIVGDNPEPVEEEQTSWPLISFSHVSMWFGDRKVLDDVSFIVNRGETLCILGRSGVGKSVSLRILMGFLKPRLGSIRVDGQEINGLHRRGNAGHPQAHHHGLSERRALRLLTVRENVAFPLRERGGQDEDQVQQVVDRLSAWSAPRT